jgi:hypothetical protein
MIFQPSGIRCLNATLSLRAPRIPKWKGQSPYWKFASSLVSVLYFMATPSDLMLNSRDYKTMRYARVASVDKGSIAILLFATSLIHIN